MNERELCLILQKQGWICNTDEVGDVFCVFSVGNVLIQIIPKIGKRPDHFRVSTSPSVSSREFSEAAGFILGESRDFVPIIVNRDPPEKLDSVCYDDVLRISEKVISWASSQDLTAGLASYRELPTTVKGAMPLRHLAALAIARDIKRLEHYRQSFQKGDRLGFVSYVSLEMIGRAISIACK